MKFARVFFSSLALLLFAHSYSQCLTPVIFALQKSLPTASPLLNHDMSTLRDSFPGKPYLYIAGKEQGLKIYNINNLTTPVLSASLNASSFNNLDVNRITQVGNYLYLALGDIFNKNTEASGMAIVNVTSPASPTVTSVYTYSLTSGAGHVAVENNYAYLSAMQNGILVFDVSNKSNIQLVSQFKPNVNYPKPNPNSSELDKINVRQITAKNNVLYVCYDAGGVRIVNATNKTQLKETGKYSNPLLLNRPRAMNNLILIDSLIYVAADYCGMEVLKIKDTSNITQVGWWNPWKCQNASNTWFNSPGHANEIAYDSACKKVFMSCGRSDVMAVSIANPALPDSCQQYGSKTDSAGTWGISVYNGTFPGQVYAAYISTWPLFIPFRSEWSGVKIITYNHQDCIEGIEEFGIGTSKLSLYPNPTNTELNIKNPFVTGAQLTIYDTNGKLILTEDIESGISTIKLVTGHYAQGIYFIKLNSDSGSYTSKFCIEKY